MALEHLVQSRHSSPVHCRLNPDIFVFVMTGTGLFSSICVVAESTSNLQVLPPVFASTSKTSEQVGRLHVVNDTFEERNVQNLNEKGTQRLRPSRIVVQSVSVKYVCAYVKFMCLSFLARLPEGTIQGYPAGILPCIPEFHCSDFQKWEVSVVRENEFSKTGCLFSDAVFDLFRRMAPCFWTRSCTIEGNEVAAAKLHEFTPDVPNEKTL